MYDLSVLIPARKEEFLARTVQDILDNKRGNTEVIVVLDGEWSDPPVTYPEGCKDVTIIYNHESIGQRAATNQACRLSKAKYVMKLDAHCALDEGFDVKMLEAYASLEDGESVTMIPALYNLHAFNWKCKKCGNEWYQGPPPNRCQLNNTDGNRPEHENPNCDNTPAMQGFGKVIVFKPRLNKRSEFYRFDTNLHFQYHGKRKKHPEAQGNLVETMSAQGSCFMLTRKKYWELNISDEEFGSWGQQGVEVACKTWLSGGRLLTNKDTWYSHMFRTQPGFTFPYHQSGRQIERARELSKRLFIENTWPQQIYPLSWLIEKFGPLDNTAKDGVPDWHTEEGRELWQKVVEEGNKFYQRQFEMTKKPDWLNYIKKTKGIIYYTDNQLNLKISHAVKRNLKKVGLPIVSSSLKPMDFGRNIYMRGYQRGFEAYFKQILTALEHSQAEIIYFCEHDWLYHPSHFDFTPERNDTFYYNWNWWRVRSKDGFAVKYDTQLVPGLVAYRDILIEYYTKVVEHLSKVGFTSENAYKVGFEPGTHGRVDFSKDYRIERFDSKFPIIDIRHDNNLTSSKWSPDAFRNPKNAQNWQESTLSKILGWDAKTDDFFEFLKQI